MTGPDAWSRRRFLGTAVAGVSLQAGSASGQEVEEDDRGIGGTGVAPPSPEGGDRGIGGTGVIGTIRRFGSIVVNDLRVTFPRSVPIRIDGRPARLRDLAVGHVVRVLARSQGTTLATSLIEAFSEVSGPISIMMPDGFSVLGQRVVVPDEKLRRRARIHRWVAVSGLRRLDGTIVASLVEWRAPGLARVAGIPRLTEGGIHIEDLAVEALPDGFVGQRVFITGRLSRGRLIVTQARSLLTELLAGRPDRLSLEDYVALDKDEVRLGSGLYSGSASSRSNLDGETRAVVTAHVSPEGHIQVDSVRAAGDSHASEHGAPPGRGRTPPRDLKEEAPGPSGAHVEAGPRGFGPGPGNGPGPGGPNAGGGPGGRSGPGGGGRHP